MQKKICVMKFYKVVIFIISLAIGFSSSTVLAEAIPAWRFAPEVYRFLQGDTLDLTAVLCNNSTATEDLNASSVAYGAGVNWLPGKNLYQAGLNIEFADILQQLNSVILTPGDCHNFVWGTVTAWKAVVHGQYTIDYASINGHNSPTSIVADNVFTINATHEPAPIPIGVLYLILEK